MSPARTGSSAPAATEVASPRPAGVVRQPKRPAAPAREEVVELYRLLYTAEGPLGLEEILDALPGAYRSHGYREYRLHLTEQGVPVKEDKWTDREKETAWRWWVSQLIEASVTAKHVTVGARDGSPVRKRRPEELTYTANRAKPPTVIQQVTEDKVVHWTPTIGDTGKRHAAGMAFLQQIRPLLDAPKFDAAHARQLLELAEKAIRT